MVLSNTSLYCINLNNYVNESIALKIMNNINNNNSNNSLDLNSIIKNIVNEITSKNEKILNDFAERLSVLEEKIDNKDNEPKPDNNEEDTTTDVTIDKPAIEVGGDQDDGSLSCLGIDFNLKKNGKNCYRNVKSITQTELSAIREGFWVYGIEKNVKTKFSKQDGKPRAALLIKIHRNDEQYLKVITNSSDVIRIISELDELAKTNNKIYPRKIHLIKLPYGGYTVK